MISNISEARQAPAIGRRSWLAWICGSGILCLGLTLLYFFEPSRSGFFPPCPFYTLTGLYCPGCGATRALHQLLHGHFFEALDLNPAIVLTLPLLALIVAYRLGVYKDLPWLSVRRSSRAAQLLFGLILVFWILRNIPSYPFSWLAP